MANETRDIEKNMRQFSMMIRNIVVTNSPGTNNRPALLAE